MTAILISIAAAVAAAVGGYFYGIDVGQDKEFAKRAREDAVVVEVRNAAMAGAAAAIAKNKPVNTTIRNEVQREIRENTVYQSCAVTDGVRGNIDAALTGRKPAGGGELPRAAPAK